MPEKQKEKLKVYEYAKCTTCQKAVRFLEAKKIPFEVIPIKEHPPTAAELKTMLGHLGGELRKLFNTSGILYREMGLSEKLGSMTEAQAFKLLGSNGMLVKRPFVLSKSEGAVGFKEPEWKKKFS
jgi:arsenate reductase